MRGVGEGAMGDEGVRKEVDECEWSKGGWCRGGGGRIR